MNGLKVTLAAATVALVSAGGLQAATIDLVAATNDGTTLVAPEATITAEMGSTLFVGDFTPNSVCPLGGSGCDGAMTLTFGFDVNNLMFDYGFGNPGDSASLSFFDGLGALLALFSLNSDAGLVFADLSAVGTFRSVLFDNTASTGAGYAYGNISYDVAAVVPLPAAGWLLFAGLGGLAAMRRRKQV